MIFLTQREGEKEKISWGCYLSVYACDTWDTVMHVEENQ